MSLTSDHVRKSFKETDDLRDAGLMTPGDILRHDDLLYGEDPRWQILDVYRPKDAEGRLPVIVSVHGGGWVYGDKERYQYYCMNLAQRGFAVVNFTYRLAPEFQYPAAIEDTNSVFQWVLSHGAEYGFDTDNIFAVGDSAGGHNLAVYSAICTNPSYAATYPFQVPEGFRPKAIGLFCAEIELRPDDPNPLTANLMKDLLSGGGTEEELRWISPIRFVTEDFPPTFLMTATGDFLIAKTPLMAEKLTEKSVPFEFHFYGDKEHILGHVFHLNIKTEDAAVCNDETCAFFRKYID